MMRRAKRSDRRRKLPSRRKLVGISVDHIWAPGSENEVLETMLVAIGRYEDGTVGEVFIDYPNETGVRKKSERTIAFGHDVAILISIALQYGAPIEVLRDAMARGEVNRMGRNVVMPSTIIGTVLERVAEEPIPEEYENAHSPG